MKEKLQTFEIFELFGNWVSFGKKLTNKTIEALSTISLKNTYSASANDLSHNFNSNFSL